jgi:hypothetical protein
MNHIIWTPTNTFRFIKPYLAKDVCTGDATYLIPNLSQLVDAPKFGETIDDIIYALCRYAATYDIMDIDPQAEIMKAAGLQPVHLNETCMETDLPFDPQLIEIKIDDIVEKIKHHKLRHAVLDVSNRHYGTQLDEFLYRIAGQDPQFERILNIEFEDIMPLKSCSRFIHNINL